MSIFKSNSTIIITCHNRVAPFLTQEIEELGFEIEETFITGVRILGTLEDCIKLNLNLRCASQVLFLVSTFRAYNPDDVYRNVSRIEWEKYIPRETYISVTSNVLNDTINNSMFANLKVKDAIVDYLRAKRGVRPETGADLTGAVVHLHWKHNDANIYLDTSGPSLGRHGYRKVPGRAPMLESLAAATIIASRWNRQSAFVNPMCGSGTLAIEAALLAKKKAPGFFRKSYPFMYLQDFENMAYLEEMERLRTQVIDDPGIEIIASDISRKAVENAKINAEAAGVYDLIRFETGDFSRTTIPEENRGVVFFNPEYGERLGETSELELTYAEIGDFLKQKCKGYNGYIFTGNMELAKKVGLKAKRRIEFYNSKIDCRLLEYEMYDGTRKFRTGNDE